MKWLICTILFFILRFADLSAQTRDVFLELGGSGGLGSVNYEKWRPPAPVKRGGPYGHEGPDPKPWWIGIRCGIGASPIDKNNGWVAVFPVMGSILFEPYRSSHALEISAGFAPSVTTKGAFFIKSPLALGYRYWPDDEDKKIFFRATYTPIFAWLVDVQWQHWFGISIGYKLS